MFLNNDINEIDSILLRFYVGLHFVDMMYITTPASWILCAPPEAGVVQYIITTKCTWQRNNDYVYDYVMIISTWQRISIIVYMDKLTIILYTSRN